MTDHTPQNAPYSAGDQLEAAFTQEIAQIASIPSDRLYRIAALTAGIFLLVSLL